MDVDQLIYRIESDTGYTSDFTATLNHPQFTELIEHEHRAVPRLMEILQGPHKGSWTILLALRQILGTDAIADEVGEFDVLREKWLAWGQKTELVSVAMEPGQALDTIIATKVMGECAHELEYVSSGRNYGQLLKCSHCGQGFNHQQHGPGEIIVRPYSTQPEWAWKVVEKCFEGGDVLVLNRLLDGRHRVSINHWTQGALEGPLGRIWDDTQYEPEFVADTMPLAVCVAAASFYLEDKAVVPFLYEEPLWTRIKGLMADKDA